MKLLFLVALLGTLNAFSQVSTCSECDACGMGGACDTDPRFLGDAEKCYSTLPECGAIPVNESSYYLIIAGFVLVFILFTAKRFKNTTSLPNLHQSLKAGSKPNLNIFK